MVNKIFKIKISVNLIIRSLIITIIEYWATGNFFILVMLIFPSLLGYICLDDYLRLCLYTREEN